MKKIIAMVLALVCILILAGCDRKSMNYIIQNEPSITGIVREADESAILIENGDSMTHFTIGDEVVVYFDGTIAETSPMQINRVYAITLTTPAERTANDRS